MKTSTPKSLVLFSVYILVLGFAGPVRAQQCVSPLPNLMPPEAQELVTDFDGNMTCDNLNAALKCSISGGNGTCTSNTGPDDEQFTVVSTNAGGEIHWTVTSTVIGGIDNVLTDSAQGANGCLYGFRFDATGGRAGFLKSNDSFARVNQVEFCADLNVEPVVAPPPAPAMVEGCFLEDGTTATIFGVTVTCNGVPNNEQRTVIVTKDTEDPDMDGNADPVPGFGFIGEDGDIDFNNVCICRGPATPIDEPQCDPNPDQVNDPATDALEPCTIDAGSQVPAEVLIQNPRCVTVGGKRRCY